MDIRTARGRQTLIDERRGIAAFRLGYKGVYRYVETDKDTICAIDGFVYTTKTGVLSSLNEFKCRYGFTEKTFFSNALQDENGMNGEWMISVSKIEETGALAMAMCSELTGMMFIVGSNVILWHLLMEKDGSLPFHTHTKMMWTQKNCNGGSKYEACMFFDMRSAVRIKVPPTDSPATPP